MAGLGAQDGCSHPLPSAPAFVNGQPPGPPAPHTHPNSIGSPRGWGSSWSPSLESWMVLFLKAERRCLIRDGDGFSPGLTTLLSWVPLESI